MKPNYSKKLLALKPGKSFIVTSAGDREKVYDAKRVLEAAGLLKHTIKTCPTKGGFKVYAI